MASRLLQPTYDRVLIKLVPTPEKTPGGIVIPENKRQPIPEGIVVAVGPGRLLDNGTMVSCTTKVGDRVLVPQANFFDFDFERYVMIHDIEVPAVIKDPPVEG